MLFWLLKVPGRLSLEEISGILEGLPGFEHSIDSVVENSKDGTVVAVRGRDQIKAEEALLPMP